MSIGHVAEPAGVQPRVHSHSEAADSHLYRSVAYRGGVTRALRVLFGMSLRRTLALIAILALAATGLSACATSSKAGHGTAVSSSSSGASSTPPSSSAAPSSSTVPVPVHVSLLENDGATFGVGMPIVARFTQPITDSSAFLKATTVTINGQPANGAWYFEKAGAGLPWVLEAHYRPQNYWTANSQISMKMPIEGLSGGGAFVFDDSLTLNMATGDAHTATVDKNTLQMQVFNNGAMVKQMPVSLGAAKTPTYNGIKVVEQKGEDLPGTNTLRPQGAVNMVGTPNDPYNLIVPWSVRVTNSGEYIHAASWNGGNIGQRSTSNGCTNLNTADAEWYYNFALVGDPVTYVNTDGGAMPFDDGFGDWNLAWSTWQAGGAVQSSTS